MVATGQCTSLTVARCVSFTVASPSRKAVYTFAAMRQCAPSQRLFTPLDQDYSML